jgi:hypothetical protein
MAEAVPAYEGSAGDRDAIERLIRREARRLTFFTLYRAECHTTAARSYNNVHMYVGAFAAGFAAAAGGTGFAGSRILAGVFGILAAALAGFLTLVKPAERSEAHWDAAKAYVRLGNDISIRFDFIPGALALDDAGRRRRRRITPAGILPAEEQAGEHEQDGGSTSLSDDREALYGFRGKCLALEDRTFPVPTFVARRARQQMRKHDEWFPPFDLREFDEWRRRIEAKTRREQAASGISATATRS